WSIRRIGSEPNLTAYFAFAEQLGCRAPTRFFLVATDCGEHRKAAGVGCPLLAQSGHCETEFQCPLLGVKRTWPKNSSMSANDPKRTWAGCLATASRLQNGINQGYSRADGVIE